MLELAKVIQILWAIFFALQIGLPAFYSGNTAGVVIGTVVYLVATLTCLTKSKLAWIVAMIVPLLPLARWAPMVFLNFWMFITGHELYQDSPATIIVIVYYAIALVLPGLLIYLLLFLDRKRLLAAFRFNQWPEYE